MRFAQRVQAALLPTGLPKRMKGVEVAARFAPARELGGDFHDFLSPEAEHARRRASATCRARAFRPRSTACSPASSFAAARSAAAICRIGRAPASVLSSVNTILHQRQLEEYYCTLCYAIFDLKRRIVTLANSGLPYPIRASADRRVADRAARRAARIVSGLDLRRVTFALHAGRPLRVLQRRRVRSDERERGANSARRG